MILSDTNLLIKGCNLHYYQFNIKTYLASTVHLTDGEDLAYRRLIDYYYDTELPIPTALPVLCRRLRLALPDVETILKEFFVETDDGWKHDYIDKEIAAYKAFLAKQKANGSKGGRRSKPDASPPLNPKEPSAKPTTNNKQLTINNKQEDKSANAPTATPFILPDWINQNHWDAWHSTPKRRKATIEQKKLAVAKLSQWRGAGIDFAKALENAAVAGWQGLFIPMPDSKPSAYAPPSPAVTTPSRQSVDPKMSQAIQESMRTLEPISKIYARLKQ